ncbi:MAG: flagellar biosynthesis protein FlhF [Lachnospiraceae bacterium]|nr:flagellar biosynthesis protein FlhF [Lachnospiraceae bacterium]
MIINKFQGKTEAEAIEKAKKEMGMDVVIMNIRTIKPKGMFGALKKATYEVTAAKEETEQTMSANAFHSPLKAHEQINFTADEPIQVPSFKRREEEEAARKADVFEQVLKESRPDTNGIEERLDNLQNMIQNRFSKDTYEDDEEEEDLEIEKKEKIKAGGAENFHFVKMLYKTLLGNDVSEIYANQILDELGNVMKAGNNVDYILSNVYQKLILKFGQPKPIDLSGSKPKVVFIIGPTGVGKTTTIAKIASKYKLEQGKKVAFLTADTYRIAATEQLRTYANILDEPFTIIYSMEEMNQAIENLEEFDLVLVDTAGFSHKNEAQREDIKELIESVDEKYDKSVYLVLSATTKYKDLLDIIDIYRAIANYKIIFTKLDETSTYGNLLNVRLYSEAELSYITNGQNVPDDIEIFDTQKIVKNLLGGK